MSDITIINSGYDVNLSGSVPVGPLSIVAMLEAGGFIVDFKDYQLHPAEAKPSPRTFCDFIDCPSPIIGLNAMCGNLPTILLAVELLKQRRPDKLIILGGPSATDSTDYILRHFPVDVIVRGEGEVTALELMRALESNADLSEIQGISYCRNGEVHHNPSRPRVQDLDTLPVLSYDKIDFNEYQGRAQIMTTRGCPYRCGFCSAHSIWKRRVTYRSPESIATELASIQDRIERIDFCDDTFVLRHDRVRAIITAMKQAGVDQPWCCHGRIDLMTPDLLRDMANAGCDHILYGIESGSNRVLQRLHKKFTIEQAKAVIEQTAKHVPRIRATYIWGFPFETLDDFYDTVVDMAENSRCTRIEVQAYLLSPLVASPLYHEYQHLLKFSPTLQLGISVLPSGRLTEYPELIDFIEKHPELCASFYYYEHLSLETKVQVMGQSGAGFAKMPDGYQR